MWFDLENENLPPSIRLIRTILYTKCKRYTYRPKLCNDNDTRVCMYVNVYMGTTRPCRYARKPYAALCIYRGNISRYLILCICFTAITRHCL